MVGDDPTAAITCELMAEMLTDLMEGDLPAEIEAAALDHLASCRACETVLADTRAVQNLARDHGRIELDPDDRDRMLGAILAEVDGAPGPTRTTEAE